MARLPTFGWMRLGGSRVRLARGFGRQPLEALQVVLVVVERDPQVAVDRDLAELLVHADPGIDPGADEQLLEFIAKRKRALGDT